MVIPDFHSRGNSWLRNSQPAVRRSRDFKVIAGRYCGAAEFWDHTGAANLDIAKDGAIALMDGAMTGKAVNQFQIDFRMQSGMITAGTPDRPIKRDARLGVGYSNWMNLTFPDQKRGKRGGLHDYGKFSATLSGKLIGYPAKGTDARLVVGWHGISAGGGGRGINVTEGFNQTFAKLQPKITIWMNTDTEIANVRFEDLHRGGIVLPDAAAAGKWKNVTFGRAVSVRTRRNSSASTRARCTAVGRWKN